MRDRVFAGYNIYGELGDNTTTAKYLPTPVSTSLVSSWLAISAGNFYTCGLAADSSQYGKAYCWGELPPCQEPSAAGAVTADATSGLAATIGPLPRRLQHSRQTG